MTTFKKKSLLPNGFKDELPPNAHLRAVLEERLLDSFKTFGYELTIPSLAEFQTNLLSGAGAVNDENTFRILDTISNQILGIRADITLQIGRIANVRLSSANRPLRLMYCGDVMRVQAPSVRPSRQFRQIGCELIGIDSIKADIEIITLSTFSLKNLGVTYLSIDLCLPKIVQLCADNLNLNYAEIKPIVEKKDLTSAKKIMNNKNNIFAQMIASIGTYARSIELLRALKNNPDIKNNSAILNLIDRLIKVADELHNNNFNHTITIDICESKGFSFQSGLSFSIFTNQLSTEIGRGGRYIIDDSLESSTGFSIFPDNLLKIIPTPPAQNKIYAPLNSDFKQVGKLRKLGKMVICEIENNLSKPSNDYNKLQAAKMGCDYILDGCDIVKLKKGK